MKPGLYQIDAEAYHADPCVEPSLSHSVAKVLLTQSPGHAWAQHPRLNPNHRRTEKKEFDLGNALHALFLEGEDRMHLVDVDDWRTNASKEERDKAYAAGEIPVNRKQHQDVLMGLERLRKQVDRLEVSRPAFKLGLPEQTLIWQEPNGVWCRVRPDWLHADHLCIDDLKIAASSHPGNAPGQFGRAVFALGHDIQSALYRRGARAVLGVDPIFRFIAFELRGREITISQLDPAAAALADAKVERAIALWGACLQSGHWPGYPKHEVLIEAPAWEIASEEAAAYEEGF